MNIAPQICAFILMAIVFMYWSFHRRLHLITSDVFRALWYSEATSLVLEVISIVVLSRMDTLPIWVADAVRKLYACSFIALTAIFKLLYVTAHVTQDINRFHKQRIVIIGIGVSFCLLTAVLPVHHLVSASGNLYSVGPVLYATYGAAIYTLVCLFYALHSDSKAAHPRLMRKRREMVATWAIIWATGGVLQFLFQDAYIIGFTSGISVLILYITLENPEAMQDSNTGYFNRNAFVTYVQSLLISDTHFELLDIVFDTGIGIDNDKQVTAEIMDYLSTLKSTEVFSLSDSEIMLAFTGYSDNISKCKDIQLRFSEPWGEDGVSMVSVRLYYMPNTALLHDSEEYLGLFSYVRHGIAKSSDVFTYVSRENLDALAQQSMTVAMIHSAIRDERVDVRYRPIYTDSEQMFTTAEAVAEILTETGECIPTKSFIGTAESTGIIIMLSEVIFKRICEFFRDSMPQQYELNYILIDLDASPSFQAAINRSFAKVLGRYHIPDRLIQLRFNSTDAGHYDDITPLNESNFMDYLRIHNSLR